MPNKFWVTPDHPPVARPEHHDRHPLPPATPAEQFALYNEHLSASRGHLDTIGKALKELNRGPRVLETRTLTIPAAAQEVGFDAGAVGVWTGDRYRIPFAALAILNPSNASVIVTTGPAQGSAPGGGQGQALIPQTSFAAWNMAGSSVSIYGAPGTVLTLTVLADSIMPYAADWGSNAQMPGGPTTTGHGVATGPLAGAVIASLGTVPTAGQMYQITVLAYVNGTTASPADDDNMRVSFNGLVAAVIPVSGTASPGPGVQPVTVNIPVTAAADGTHNCNVVAVGNATATAIYHATILATPLVPV